MKKISFTITEETVRADIEEAARVLEEDGAIQFPDEDSRKEFFDSCVETVFLRYENNGNGSIQTDYELFVVDEAELWGYIVPEE